MNQTTKRFLIKGRVIRLAQAKSLANEFLQLYNQSRKAKKNKSLIFTITLDNKDEYQRSDLSIFDKDETTLADRVKSIEMVFSTIPVDTKVTAILTHNSSVEPQNEITVFGPDEIWVYGIIKRFEDLVNSFEPQINYVERLNWQIILFLSLSIGFLFGLLLNVIIAWSAVTTTGSQFLDTLLFPQEPIDYLWRYAIGAVIGLTPALLSRDWLKSFWPSVEIQIGPNHKFREKEIRSRWKQFMVIAIIPIILGVVSDFITR